jgi:hypothetical protein
LGEKDWLEKEFDRIERASIQTGAALDLIDRAIVLQRGFILPANRKGKADTNDAQSIFMDFYLNLMNFLSRESKRRRPIDWQLYGSQKNPGWKKFKKNR